MSFFTILYTIFIRPLQLLFEVIFVLANAFVGHPGFAILFLSLIMNFLVLPLYKRADAMQEKERDIEAKLHDGVVHIKKTFFGDERMMMLQTYYRQNQYKPTNALHGSISLFLEIPFFIAAYQFLSNLNVLQGISFGPISNLGAPDALLTIGGISINLLPILMTAVNVISSAIYLKGFPLKTKVQLYAMALFFLAFLYTSPSGLVFYWTLNNLFSLAKNCFYKLKNPAKILAVLSSIAGAASFLFGIFGYETTSLRKKTFIIGLGVLLQLPILITVVKKKWHTRLDKRENTCNKKVFLLGALFLSVLIGLLIPSSILAASPQEFINVTAFHNPLWYLVSSFSFACGTFLVWCSIFYWLASPAGRIFFEKAIWLLCGVTVVNYMFFGTNLGILFANLQYEKGLDFTIGQQLINLCVLLAVAAVLYFVICKWRRVLPGVLLTLTIALGGMSVYNVIHIAGPVSNLKIQATQLSTEQPHFNLSKTGKNVIVFLLDRGLNQCVPYIFNEKPEIKNQFEGFTYYSNTISFGGFTNFGTPATLGGYEYTPVEINKRPSESLVHKHNESIKVLPALYNTHGYNVTVCDPSYANYQWVPDLSVYNAYPDIHTYITEGVFVDETSGQHLITNNHRNFFCFSMMKAMPLFLQEPMYDRGNYKQADALTEDRIYSTQTLQGTMVSNGIKNSFMQSYSTLLHLPSMTNICEESANTFLMMINNTTHEPMLLQEPDYEPAMHVDNTKYHENDADRFTLNGRTLKMDNFDQIIHYQANLAALKQLGKWFDFMRQNDVYDNTKIILVSDHGRPLQQLDDLILDDGSDTSKNAEFYYPLLMVKDFNSKLFTESKAFMTNADVATLAVKDTIENPVNPFTGKAINNQEKTAHDQYITASHVWDTDTNKGNTFLPSKWLAVKDNIWDKSNWRFIEEEVTIPAEAK